LGEENTLLSGGRLYPFPLNFCSLTYKINNFTNENPANKFEKIKLGFHILRRRKTGISSAFAISTAVSPASVCYLSKAENFQINSCSLKEILSDLIDNEMHELSIPPTHSLSGIKYNYFLELLQENQEEKVNSMQSNLFDTLNKEFADCKCYRITTPKTYHASITDEIMSKTIES